MELPKYNEQRKIADSGILIVKTIVEQELGWIFRKSTLDDDFGIDGYIDILEEGKYVTGKSIGVQVKAGKSYFTNITKSGWLLYGENKHLNYYLNNQIPIIIIIVDTETRNAYWNEITLHTILKTETAWKINISKNRVLKNQEELYEIAGNFIDYGPQLEYQALINNKMVNSELVHVALLKEEVAVGSLEGLETLSKWLTASDERIQKCRNKIVLTIFGYENDKRELFEIPEVRFWMKQAFLSFKYWGYFMAMFKEIRRYSTIKTLMSCIVTFRKKDTNALTKQVEVEYDSMEVEEFIQELFSGLNEFATLYKIEEKYVFEQSMLIRQTLQNLSDKRVDELRKKFGFK